MRLKRVFAGQMNITLIFLSLSIFALNLTIYSQNYLSGAECVSYDSIYHRYLVSSFSNGRIVAVDTLGNQTIFRDGLGACLGNCIIGDTLFVSRGTSIMGFSLHTAQTVFNLAVPGSIQMDGMTSDNSGNLYVVDMNRGALFRINLSNPIPEEFIPSGLPGLPQDLVFDAVRNRLIICSFSPQSPLVAVNITDARIDTLVITPMGDFDGIAQDEEGNIYLASWNSGAIHRYYRHFMNPPVTIASGFTSPTNIDFNRENHILAVPDFNQNTLDLITVPENYLDLYITSSTRTGHIPHTVYFADCTAARPAAISWNWDFDNDGITDAQTPHPSWTYNAPGVYSVSLTVSSDSLTETALWENFIEVFDGESALNFSDMSSLVSVLATPELNITGALTLEAWICPSGWGTHSLFGYGRILDKGSFALYLISNRPGFNEHCLLLQLTDRNGQTGYSCTPSNSILMSDWQHVAATYDSASNDVRLYIDGIEQSLTQIGTISGGLVDHLQVNLNIGNSQNQVCAFQGILDEIRIWDTVRSLPEIQGAMGQLLTGTESGLIGYWNMNEGNGNIINDQTLNHNHGTLRDITWTAGTPFSASFFTEAQPEMYIPSPALFYGYPNPFNSEIHIQYELSRKTGITLQIYDVNGRHIQTLENSFKDAGRYLVRWDGRDDAGNQVSSGVFLLQLKTENFQQTRRLVFVK